MMVIKVEIWPGGYEDNKQLISQINVANITPLRENAQYVYSLNGGDWEREVQIKHCRSDGALKLVEKVVKKVNRLSDK